MIGAIIGDIAGSRYETRRCYNKDFELLAYGDFTDDTVMSLAIADAVLRCNGEYGNLGQEAIASMQKFGREYPHRGYGRAFELWIYSEYPAPYNSYGNGSAMRVSACGFAAQSVEEVKILSRKVTEVTHDHPEGIKGAEATAVAVYLARTGKNKSEIRDYIDKNYYTMNFTLDSVRNTYKFSTSCQNSVPQAIEAFLESENFEEAIRNAVYLGGDSDTIAAIAGSIAEAYYGTPYDLRDAALLYLDKTLKNVLFEFEKKFPPKIKVL